MNLLNSILNKSKKAALEADIHENVFINKIDISEREKRGGGVNSKTLFIEFVKVDPKTKATLGAHEISWFKLDYTSEYVKDNAIEFLGQVTAILDAHLPKETVDEKFTVLQDCGINSIEDFETVIKTDEGVKKLSKAINDQFFAILEEFVGPYTEGTKLLRIKLVYDKNGKYIQAPRYGDFTESMEVSPENSKLKLSKSDKANKAKASAIAAGEEQKNASLMTEL